MLRTYHPLPRHSIFTLQTYLEHLVCQVWCNADNNITCSVLLDPSFAVYYNKYHWLKIQVDLIYERCKPLTKIQRDDIKNAFNINNRIQDLCDGNISPIALEVLPGVVKDYMKPTLIDFYNILLKSSEKLKYYNNLLTLNPFKTCPCCGLIPIESAKSNYREDNDHYLPKANFPFSVVNFQNLVPLCSKCNKKCKSTKNPFSNNRISYFPFDGARADLDVSILINTQPDTTYLALKEEEIEFAFSGDPDKNETWDYLFEIKERYNEEICSLTYSELRTITNRILKSSVRDDGLTYEQIIDDKIDDYSIDPYVYSHFLKKSFLKTIKTKPEWMAVYL